MKFSTNACKAAFMLDCCVLLHFARPQVDGGDPQCHLLCQPLPAEHQERPVLMNLRPSAPPPPPSAAHRDTRLGEDLDFRMHKRQKRLYYRHRITLHTAGARIHTN